MAETKEVIDVLLAAVDVLGQYHIFADLTPEARAVLERWALLRFEQGNSRGGV